MIEPGPWADGNSRSVSWTILFTTNYTNTINSAIKGTTMAAITANDLKTRGVAALEAALENTSDAVISVRGKDRFVVMGIAHYHHLRECELEAALREAKADVAAGRFVRESAGAHVKRIEVQTRGKAGKVKRRAV
jgi:PHD/YefM family antitoxin component YafN of YafNO toxin-antitoxin module